MDNTPLISIIIPAFNVGNYISKCIKSIIGQDYTNLEIIIVDDGSSDKTGEIIDDFARCDNRIVVIHKENEGVSVARNVGIDKASGEYIVFVDGDDYLSKEAITYMLYVVGKTYCDFCISENCYTKTQEQQIEKDDISILTPEETVALLLSPRVIVGCWNKIYKKTFLKDNHIRFSTNLFFGEGLNFIVNCAQASSNVGVGQRKVYYYRRNNELSATSKFNIEKLRNGEQALKKIKDSIHIKSNLIDHMYSLHVSLFCLGAMTRLINNKARDKYNEDYTRWKKELNIRKKDVLQCSEISLYRKILILSGCILPGLIAKLDNLRRKKIVNSSIK